MVLSKNYFKPAIFQYFESRWSSIQVLHWEWGKYVLNLRQGFFEVCLILIFIQGLTIERLWCLGFVKFGLSLLLERPHDIKRKIFLKGQNVYWKGIQLKRLEWQGWIWEQLIIFHWFNSSSGKGNNSWVSFPLIACFWVFWTWFFWLTIDACCKGRNY